MNLSPELSIVMPCLNEAETIETCILKVKSFLKKNSVEGEIVISDNGSTDNSVEIAKKHNAKIVFAQKKGYGSALKTGIENSCGKYIIIGDADDSYDFNTLMPFLDELRKGADLVIGNRFKGGIKKNAMPFLHKYLGNPVLSLIGRLFFKISIGDFHCGLRGFSKQAYGKMQLKTIGMEFASEMIVKSKLNNLKIIEVPTILSKDGRSRKPHLRTWRDGWRHLRFLLLYAPNWLFLYPGIFFSILGFVLSVLLIINPIVFKDIVLDVHTLLYCSMFSLVGFQFIIFYGFTKIYAVESGLIPKSNRYNSIFKYVNLEKGLFIGIIVFTIGLFLSYRSLDIWRNLNYKTLNPSQTLRIVIPAITFIQIGIQIILYSFFFSILGLKKSR